MRDLGFAGSGFEQLAKAVVRDLRLLNIIASSPDAVQAERGNMVLVPDERGVKLSWEMKLVVRGAKFGTPEHNMLSDTLTTAASAVLAQLGYSVVMEREYDGWLVAIVTGLPWPGDLVQPDPAAD